MITNLINVTAQMQYNNFVTTSSLCSDSVHLCKPNSDLGEKKRYET